MIDDETRGALKFAARDMLLVAETVAGLSEEERGLFRAEIAKAATGQPARSNLFALSSLLRYAWGAALWSRD